MIGGNKLFKTKRENSLKKTDFVFIGKKKVWFMVFNATFNTISVISWWSVLLVAETIVPGENYWHAASHLRQKHGTMLKLKAINTLII